MKRLYLHGGHFKTGTTALQYALAGQRPLLAQHGVLYPHWPNRPNPYQHGSRLALWHPTGADRLEEDLAQFGAHVRDVPEQHIILSAETVSCFDRAAFERFKRAIGPGLELVLVLGLRHWAGFSASRWQEDIRFGDSLTFPEMMTQLEADFDVSRNGDFSILPRDAASVFDDVRLVPYTRAGMLNALLDALDIPPDVKPALLSGATIANQGLDFVRQEALRLANYTLGVRHDRPRDSVYQTAMSKFGHGTIWGRISKVEAFLESGSDQSARFAAMLERAKVTRPISDWAPLLEHWRTRLDARLQALGLDAMPADWGADEASRSVSYTELTLGDIDPDVREAFDAALPS